MFTPPRPVRAFKTLQAINDALESDQGALFRKYLGEEMAQAKDPFREASFSFRTHLGASIVGRDCARALWYSFRWASSVRHQGRILRLFNRGHLEEPRFVALLRMIGCKVWSKDDLGNQFKVIAHNNHFGGSLDGVGVGIPDNPGNPMLLEFKTHNDKNFAKLQANGVRSAKYEHFVQTQCYMGGYQLTQALYLATNKNDDDLYGEIINFDKEIFEASMDRAGKIIFADVPPPKINESPGWYTCKVCDFRVICHQNGMPERNCRTCVHVKPGDNGNWTCTRHNVSLTEASQLAGCPDYRWNPAI